MCIGIAASLCRIRQMNDPDFDIFFGNACGILYRYGTVIRIALIGCVVVRLLCLTPCQQQTARCCRKLAGEANNINQLAHRANAGGFALVAVELVKLKNRIVEIINQLSDDWKNKKGKRI